MARIFLIGFMGSGKTTLGKQVAEILHYEFLDLDQLIEENEGIPVSEIFSSKGEDYFRIKESFYLKSLSKKNNLVIATGGGTPCYFDNMNWMIAHGTTVYLQLDPENLFLRLQPEAGHRPLLREKSDEELLQFIKNKLKERVPFYSLSQFTVDANGIQALTLAGKFSQR